MQSDTEREMEIPPDQITVTLVGNRYPGKLIRFLKRTYHAVVSQHEKGIYYVNGLLFPMQILVQRQLSGRENVWLSRLRQGLRLKEDIEPLITVYKGKEKDPLYSAAMDLIVRANWNVYEEGTRMCDALNELFALRYGVELEEKKREGVEQGMEQGIEQGLEQGIRALVETCRDFGITEEETVSTVMKRFSMPKEKAELCVHRYWDSCVAV